MSTISPPVGYDIDEPAIIVADLDELAVIDRWFSIILQLMAGNGLRKPGGE
jgi:hypothetical protein